LHISEPRLIDAHPHGIEPIKEVEHPHGTEGVDAKLVIFFLVDLYAASAFQIDDVQNSVRYDKRVAGAEAFRDIEGTVNTLLDKHSWVFESFRLLHNEVGVIGCVLVHFRVVASRSVFGSAEPVVEFPLCHTVGKGAFRGVA